MESIEVYEIKRTAEYTFNPSTEFVLPTQLVLCRPLMGTDLLLRFLSDERPGIIEPFVEHLTNSLGKIASDVDTSNFNFAFQMDHLKLHPELARLIKSVTLTLLQYEKYPDLHDKEQILIQVNDNVRSYLLPSYFELESLVKVIPRDEAIGLYKRFVDFRTDFYSQQLIRPVEDLKSMFELATGHTDGPHSGKAYLTSQGVAGVKQSKCLWHELLKDFDDPELGYAVACHYDFHAMQYYNEYFVLTRPKTLMDGHGLCDFCWHDTRIVDEIVHPDQSFWDEL
ncbi:MAG: L-2-amino-thiazoline-4-carboxylic acid hydrolase [Candidatus Thorarchaeota archaeon]